MRRVDGSIELRSGIWHWRLRQEGGGRRLHLVAPADERNEMVVPVPSGWDDFSQQAVLRLATAATERKFPTEDGQTWTVLVRPAGPGPAAGRPPSAMILFHCNGRACLSTRGPHAPLGQLTHEELLRQLETCLES